MKFTTIQSSMCDGYAYNGGRQELFVRFNKGAIYRYDSVAESEMLALLAAPSFGTYLNAEIKPRHTATRIE